ncbi:MAG: FAD:protein FMN transferase [Planctomycetes bacterium]|nr:FAD:protein FMN transferase [Planctomycetota bacterium]
MRSRHKTLLVTTGICVVLVALLMRYAARRPAPDEAQTPRYVSRTADIMASPITVQVAAEHALVATEKVFAIFRDVDTRMSEWKETSPLSAVNRRAGGEAVPVPDDLRAVLRRGVEIGDITGGAFDVTWAALWGLWDFRAAEPRVPDDEEIARRVALVDYRRLEIDDDAGRVLLPERGMMLGLGGIAKGHALDLAAAELRAGGVESFLISAAGQMMVGGMKHDRAWRIGIRDPRGAPNDFFAHLEVTDVSVSTSGDYERFFLLDGVRYHHILDPRTGRPARGVRSATVVCADATLADALSTSLIVLGTDGALALVETLEGVETVLVDEQARVHVTSGLEGRLIMRHDPIR